MAEQINQTLPNFRAHKAAKLHLSSGYAEYLIKIKNKARRILNYGSFLTSIFLDSALYITEIGIYKLFALLGSLTGILLIALLLLFVAEKSGFLLTFEEYTGFNVYQSFYSFKKYAQVFVVAIIGLLLSRRLWQIIYALYTNKLKRTINTLKTDLNQTNQLYHYSLAKNNQLKDSIASLSHDVLKPITRMKLLLESSEDKQINKSQKDLDHDIELLQKNLKAVDRYFGEYLTWCKINSSDSASSSCIFSLTDLIDEITDRARHLAAEKNITLNYAPLDKECSCFGNMVIVERALYNILDNAIKYSPQHSSVSVTIMPENEYVFVWIVDSGGGIDPKVLSQLGSPFNRGSCASQDGSGLGLAIAIRAAETQNARLRIDSQHGYGTAIGFPILLNKTTR